jgi:hypothetical protein
MRDALVTPTKIRFSKLENVAQGYGPKIRDLALVGTTVRCKTSFGEQPVKAHRGLQPAMEGDCEESGYRSAPILRYAINVRFVRQQLRAIDFDDRSAPRTQRDLGFGAASVRPAPGREHPFHPPSGLVPFIGAPRYGNSLYHPQNYRPIAHFQRSVEQYVCSCEEAMAREWLPLAPMCHPLRNEKFARAASGRRIATGGSSPGKLRQCRGTGVSMPVFGANIGNSTAFHNNDPTCALNNEATFHLCLSLIATFIWQFSIALAFVSVQSKYRC